MASKSHSFWPRFLSYSVNITTWQETYATQRQMNAAGEKWGVLVRFDGDELDSVTIGLETGSPADTIDLEIQGVDTTHDTILQTGFPDGTAIPNGTASVSDKGDVTELVTFSFGATGPSPSGFHWLVFSPTSAGPFDIRPTHAADWAYQALNRTYPFERLYDGSDWVNAISTGAAILRIRKKDGSYLSQAALGYSPFSDKDQTINARSHSGTTCAGVKFTAPYDMKLAGLKLSMTAMAAYLGCEVVVVDDSDTELARGIGPFYYWISNFHQLLLLDEAASLTKGSTYRVYLRNPGEDANTFDFLTVSINAGDEAHVGLTSGEFVYTTADDPPAEGGSGTWTDTTLEIPLIALIDEQDLGELGGGGGGGGCPGLVGSGGLITPNF